ncbi:beta-galactosidase trimerization domain-containing protein [Anaerocolumna sp. AGMB13020]|uniref:alpha-amylase family protein n=1 Tax=Anaerocolumna sp. AGMB13020 TaxID=3081750 RepID=UPI00295401E2|nr:beta-galactosidase trimerization domain-containing protein [Anaerocolumna sp. AGMB13020]WOO37736.1 beta-galactosidase trimerization domain-containing protein [Anaerocolumna sp. AGMB13020]
MKYRQVHLDFHTSEKIEGIGEKFSKEQFQEALKKGCVSSITLFSKCHHGWAYHPSRANEIHPNLNFDLLGAQISAAHELGVKTPVYLSAGFDEKIARRHPEWIVRMKDDSMLWTKSFLEPGYHKLCINTPYLDYLLEQIKEVCENYEADGIFLDIIGVQPCYCRHCRETMEQEGMDPFKEADVMTLAERVYAKYAMRVRETIDSVKPGLPVFHNGGHIRRGRRDLAYMNSHLELESLPTGGWGYDHFPLSAAYARTLGMEYLGMTGKFHQSWGEFGGFKHPNALRYEASLSIANGAGVSIGDQLHPSGEMDMATYSLIGKAYEELSLKEPWLLKAENLADIGVLSAEAVIEKSGFHDRALAEAAKLADIGAARILLEGHYLFHVIDEEEDFTRYSLLVLPDIILLETKLKEKLEQYVVQGGKLLATGSSGLNSEKTDFQLDFGIRYLRENEFRPDYFRPGFTIEDLDTSAFVMYSQGYAIEMVSGKELGSRENPYFNRTAAAFCSHLHSPARNEKAGPGMVSGKDGIYISWEVFGDYATAGSLILKRMVQYALDQLLNDKAAVRTSLPAQGIVTLTKQKSRYVVHLLYGVPVKRGKNTEVIEDIQPLYEIEVRLNCTEEIKRIYLAPGEIELKYIQKKESVEFKVPKLELHQMVVAEY